MMKSINRRSLLYFALAVAAALALYGLSARLAAESGGKTAAFVTDSREIFSLAYQSGKTPADVWREVNALGVAGAAVSEFTGDELATEWDGATMSGKLLQKPEREEIPENIKEQLIVELYSKQ